MNYELFNSKFSLVILIIVFLTIIGLLIFRANKLKKRINQLISENVRLSEESFRGKELDKMKSDFLTTMAHQLRTPLTRIKWALKSLYDESVIFSKEQKNILKTGIEANENMVELVNNFLNIVKTEEAYFSYNFKDVFLDDLIMDLIKKYYSPASQKKIKIEFYTTVEKHLPVKADVYKLNLVLRNLMDNSLHYTPEGGRINIILDNLGDYARVAVKDTGIGIPKEEISNIFTRFFRAKNAMRVKTEGTGLGLYISREIIEAHGGKIWVESEEGKGATFYFTIPFQKE